jgi:transcriptional regulator with PAS, ATPase and Fis domain
MIPPLRERTEDISLLVEHFLKKYHEKYNKKTLGVSGKALQALLKYKWPGNIRELENMIERGIILTDNNHSIDMKSFFPSLSEPSHPLNISSKGELGHSAEQNASQGDVINQLLDNEFDLSQFEQQILESAMQKAEGNVTQAARYLGITRPQMAYRLKK